MRLFVFIIRPSVGAQSTVNTKECRLPGTADLLFLPAHHPGDEGIGARLLALCLWVRGFWIWSRDPSRFSPLLITWQLVPMGEAVLYAPLPTGSWLVPLPWGDYVLCSRPV
jgi:hypothetical protein